MRMEHNSKSLIERKLQKCIAYFCNVAGKNEAICFLRMLLNHEAIHDDVQYVGIGRFMIMLTIPGNVQCSIRTRNLIHAHN